MISLQLTRYSGLRDALAMKRILIVHNLLEGQKIVHELDDKDFAIELVEGETFDEDDNLDVESRLFFKVD